MDEWRMTASEPYDIAVVIGRFQPLHKAHEHLLWRANQVAKRTLVLIGSAHIARDTRNPFSFTERKGLIESFAAQRGLKNPVYIFDVVDQLYNDQLWTARVQACVESMPCGTKAPRVCIIGHRKDGTSYYLDMFPKWDLIEVENVGMRHDGTYIRNHYFTSQDDLTWTPDLSAAVVGFMLEFKKTAEYKRLQDEYKHLQEYKSQFAGLRYAPTFVTGDAVVVLNGHILLVKRKSHPGRGLWALPGGFLSQGETIQQCIVRELYEETQIQVPRKLMEASLEFTHTFDAPSRSLRGRTITHAGLFLPQLNEGLPHVVGTDDAEKAKWFAISDFYGMSEQMFEDHYSLGKFMINRAG